MFVRGGILSVPWSLTRLDEVGLKKAPSCYALFKSRLARNGVQSDRHGVPGRRLKVKTMMNDNPAAKWKSLSEDDKRKFKREARELAERLQEEKKRIAGCPRSRTSSSSSSPAGHEHGGVHAE